MFDHCLYFNTAALARRLETEWTGAFAQFGLSPPQAFMLRAVLAQPGRQQRELADDLAIAKSTATRALDFLSAKGFIERRAGAGDGREKCIFPTGEAVAMHAALDAASGAVTARLQRLLGKGEFAGTVSRIREVRSALD